MREASRWSTRQIGLAVAAASAVVVVGGVGLLLYRAGGTGQSGSPATGAGATPGGLASPPPLAPPVDIARTGLANVGKAKVQYVDRKDPTRVLGLIEWSKVDPMPGGRSVVEQPKATIYLEGAQRLVVTAARARLFARGPTDPPESGVFEGEVRAALHGPGSADTDTPLVEFVTRGLTFDLALGEVGTTQDFTIAGSGVNVAGSGLRIVSNQVDGRLELLRVEHVTTARLSPSAVSAAFTKAKGEVDAARAAEPKGREEPATANTGAAVPVVVYAATAIGSVAATQQDREALAESLTVQFAMQGGRLAPGAIAAIRGVDRTGSRFDLPVNPTPAREQEGTDLAADNAVKVQAPVDDTVSIAFTGPFEIRPKPQNDVSPLAAERLAVTLKGNARVTAPGQGVFAKGGLLAYGATTATLIAAAEATPQAERPAAEKPRERAALASILLAGRGYVLAESLIATLTTGSVRIDGAGELGGLSGKTSTVPEPDNAGCLVPVPHIAWAQQATITLTPQAESHQASDPPTDKVTAQITAPAWLTVLGATFDGNVIATDGRLTRRGEMAQASAQSIAVMCVNPATVADSPQQTAPPPLLLSKITMSGDAAMTDGRGNSLASTDLTIDFAPVPVGQRAAVLAGRDPVAILAFGNVIAKQSGSDTAKDAPPAATIATSKLTARLTRDGNDALTAERVFAEGGLRIATDNRLTVSAERANVEVATQVVDLLGDTVSIEQSGATITGTQMRVDGLRRELFVHGPGHIASVSALGRPVFSAAWQRSLRLDDSKGEAELRGDVAATSSQSDLESDVLRAGSILINFTPGLAEAADSSSASVDPDANGSADKLIRNIARIEARGQSVEAEDGVKATVESRRFRAIAATPPAPGAPADALPTPLQRGELARLLYLESDRLVVEPSAGQFTVPTPGRLFIDDRPASAAKPIDATLPANSAFASSASGTSLFDWNGSLTLSQATGTMQMSSAPTSDGATLSGPGNVRLVHRPAVKDGAAPAADRVITITATSLQAVLAGLNATASPSGLSAGRTALTLASATGNVEVTGEGGQRLNADRVAYDAVLRSAVAEGLGSVEQAGEGFVGRVTAIDPARPTPVVARRLRYDLATGRIDIIEPMPVVVPR